MKTEIKVRLGLGEYADYKSIIDVEMKDYETNQCTEIFVDNFLELIPVNSTMNALNIWYTKLRKGGQLIVMGTDLVQVAKAVFTKTLKVPQINEILFGRENIQYRSCLTLDDVVTLLEHMKLTVVTKRLTDLKYTIVAERK